MTGTPFTAMFPATSSFASGFAVPMPTFPVLRENRFGGLSQKFQLRYTQGPMSLANIFLVEAIFFTIVEIDSFEGVGVDVALTTENAMVMHNRQTPMLRTSLVV
jgi:hypothetical protein